MYIKRTFSLISVMKFSGGHLIWLSALSLVSVLLYEVAGLTWLAIPWLPVSLIGTAVAFYVGFKNNSAYDRMWESRKIWGGIVNDSRSWGIAVKHYLSNIFTEKDLTEKELYELKKVIIYRHIVWLYTLRKQLLKPTPWEHINAGRFIKKMAKQRIKNFGLGMVADQDSVDHIEELLSEKDQSYVSDAKNQATRLIDLQAEDLKGLREKYIIDDFRHMELQKLLNLFYTHQGKCERIKNYPLPRQYASSSMIFIGIFIVLIPFGMMPEFSKLGEYAIWMTVPFATLVGWVFVMMELIGDYSENPFEGMANDIPMFSLCRTIEIDLRQMLNETDLPDKAEPVNNVLM